MRKMRRARRAHLLDVMGYVDREHARNRWLAAGDRRLALIRAGDNSARGIARFREACAAERDLYKRYRALRDS